jgi:exodeoxyribonuclease VII large subunit
MRQPADKKETSLMLIYDMDQKLLNRLKIWRGQQAAREGVEPYRVLPNVTLEALATQKPLTKEAFFAVKGFKEAKWQRYGTMLLPMMADAVEMEEQVIGRDAKSCVSETTKTENQMRDARSCVSETTKTENQMRDARSCVSTDTDDTYTVSTFLNLLNDSFAGMFVRIRGEVSAVDHRDRTIYFGLKDPQDGSLIACLMFRSNYTLCGIELEIGQEIILEGAPEVYKPTGRLSIKATTIELVGEGALQKAYNDLKKKLEQEGVFAEDTKRPLPDFPERIALITSRDGAAIGDFMMNLGRYGFRVSLYHSSVEGMRAVPELSKALKQVAKKSHEYDAVVIIRGGGSLESLQAFNNETLVRAVAAFPIPVLAGIGHEKDVSLVALAADVMVSTPTATAKALSQSWSQAELQLARHERSLFDGFEKSLHAKMQTLESTQQILVNYLQTVLDRFTRTEQKFLRCLETLRFWLVERRQSLARSQKNLPQQYQALLKMTQEQLKRFALTLAQHNPERLLKLGYSLVFKQGRLIRSTAEVSPGDRLDLRVSDGTIATQAE